MATKITDHVQASLARLPEHRKDKTNITLLLTALGNQTQALEDAWYQLLTERQIDTAIGEQLDDIGDIVGQPRNGASDADYRRYLRARFAANNSEGRVEDILRVARRVLDDTTLDLLLEQYYPASMVLRVRLGLVTDSVAAILIDLLRDARAGGVRMLLHYLTDSEANSFTFGSVTALSSGISAGATTIPVNSTVGFADTGTIMLSVSLGVEEDFVYHTKDATNFYGATGTTNAHSSGASVRTANSTTQGFDDDASPGTGGKWSSVLE